MNDLVKGALKKAMKEHGESLCSEIGRLKGLLFDVCPSYRKEINVLTMAVQEGLVAELKKDSISDVYLHSLSNRLHNATGIEKGLAEWSLRAWAEAMGLGLPPNTLYCSFCDKSQQDVHCLISGPTAYICDECADLCMDIVKEEQGKEQFDLQMREWEKATSQFFNKHKGKSAEAFFKRLGLDVYDRFAAKKTYQMLFSEDGGDGNVRFFIKTILDTNNAVQIYENHELIEELARMYGSEPADHAMKMIAFLSLGKMYIEAVGKTAEALEKKALEKRKAEMAQPFEFVDLKFFAWETDLPNAPRREQRQYNTSFPQSITCHIYYELQMRVGVVPGPELTYEVLHRYYYPDGSLMRKRQYDDVVFSENQGYSLNSVSASGWDVPGRWKLGTYRVEILIDGGEFAKGSFTIE